MILRRFMQHVKEQNWFAVGLDVIVVIVGIFLGLQVQNWYEDRADRQLEKSYLNKLHSDTNQLIDLASTAVANSQKISKNLSELSQMLIDNQVTENITKLQCNALTYSHIYVTQIVSLPTLNELLSSGQILLIRNENIRSLISEFTLQTEKTMILLNSLQADKFDFIREYSEIIKLNSILASNGESFDDVNAECDYQLMLSNDEFKNRLFGNASRYNAHVTVTVSQLNALQKLHDEIERELNISH